MIAKRTARPRQRTEETTCAAPRRNIGESPLSWLASRKDKDGRPLLSDAEFNAGEKLSRDFWFAEMTPRVTANWSLLLTTGSGRRGAPDHGPDAREAALAARERVRCALAAVGPDLAGVLIDVCCHAKGLEASEKALGWPQRSGKVILQIALRQLARHYGILADEAKLPAGPVRIRHWGADGYRPTIESEAE